MIHNENVLAFGATFGVHMFVKKSVKKGDDVVMVVVYDHDSQKVDVILDSALKNVVDVLSLEEIYVMVFFIFYFQ